MHAYCYASGEIGFGRSIPDGALPMARGPAKALKPFIEVKSRHGYKSRIVKGRLKKIPGTDVLLVPGIPEAPDQDAGLDALHAFLGWIGPHAPKGITVHRT